MMQSLSIACCMFAAAAAAAAAVTAANRQIGDPFDVVTQHGPQINQNQLDKTMKYIEKVVPFWKKETSCCFFTLLQVINKL